MYEPPVAFTEACDRLGIELEPQELRHLARYLEMLLETNKLFNLTAITDPDQAWMRHILDSLTLLGHLGDAKSIVDVGSGGGLPGVPLAITQPERQFTLLEATGKKARFLASVAADMGMKNLKVITDRAETVGQQKPLRERFDLAVCRAVGPMNVLLELTLPLVKVGGRLLAMKGAKVEQEMTDAGDALMSLGGGAVEFYLAMPGIEEDAVIVEVNKEQPTPKEYPRRPGVPKMEPL